MLTMAVTKGFAFSARWNPYCSQLLRPGTRVLDANSGIRPPWMHRWTRTLFLFLSLFSFSFSFSFSISFSLVNARARSLTRPWRHRFERDRTDDEGGSASTLERKPFCCIYFVRNFRFQFQALWCPIERYINGIKFQNIMRSHSKTNFINCSLSLNIYMCMCVCVCISFFFYVYVFFTYIRFISLSSSFPFLSIIRNHDFVDGCFLEITFEETLLIGHRFDEYKRTNYNT